MSTTDREELSRLVGLAHDATAHIGFRTSAVQLYLDGSRAAERVIPGPLGVAIAGVLAMAAEERRAARIGGIMGERNTTLALALAVLELAVSTPTGDDA